MKERWLLWLMLAVVLFIAGWLALGLLRGEDSGSAGGAGVGIKLELEGVTRQARLRENEDGSYTYELRGPSGEVQRLSPDEFSQILHDEGLAGNWLAKLFNISSKTGIIWVSMGLLGQLLFTARMIVQWLASEKNKRSVVPPIFWWLSVVGAVMLLAYFLWRWDIVGVLGQAFGLAIYFRNIHLIRRHKSAIVVPPEAPPEQ